MSDLEYPACINELYQSGCLANKAFLTLMAVAKMSEKYHFGTFCSWNPRPRSVYGHFCKSTEWKFIEEPSSGKKWQGSSHSTSRVPGRNFSPPQTYD